MLCGSDLLRISEQGRHKRVMTSEKDVAGKPSKGVISSKVQQWMSSTWPLRGTLECKIHPRAVWMEARELTLHTPSVSYWVKTALRVCMGGTVGRVNSHMLLSLLRWVKWAPIALGQSSVKKHMFWLLKAKAWNFAICSNMDGPGGDCANWDKSDRERQILFDITYMWNLRNTTN